ncbi:Asp23/Gls24 family envelope stress response protein [Bacillus sp. 31A1R]|uniref:Asp23/Gls24 family envelope stress response protein n=1 Tax=Robertmurraya mangrovi TaxID=3098077 RepID=A0ABU5IU47_9BACI|nr:Asp23/Gls24 family envelope stress response protein [Bacillus sp. 31A1R]MDZ5470661.1 Asp23/Gls24 family envelope stress response protein [Bacillus sp. 31A1R]
MSKGHISSEKELALNNVITAIIESNVSEHGEIIIYKYKNDLLATLLKKRSVVKNGVNIKIFDDKDVLIQLNLMIQKGYNMIKKIERLQKTIQEEIQLLTGLTVRQINVTLLDVFTK